MADFFDIPDFIAIDFETATAQMNSACAVGIAIVRDGKVADTFYSLIQPPANQYDKNNIAVHGITPEDTRNAPDFGDVWWEIRHLFGPCPVVAHNASFDMSVLAMAYDLFWSHLPSFKFVDSVNIAKGFVPGSRSLKHCTEVLGIELKNHHNALDDAIACAEVVLACIQKSPFSSLPAFCFGTPGLKIYSIEDFKPYDVFIKHSYNKPQGIRYPTHIDHRAIHPTCDCQDPNHPLCGKAIVFTGELSMGRAEAMQRAVDVGAILRNTISRKVAYLVVGIQDLRIVGEDGLSSKEEEAIALNAAGKADIKLIREAEFLELLQGNCPQV